MIPCAVAIIFLTDRIVTGGETLVPTSKVP